MIYYSSIINYTENRIIFWYNSNINGATVSRPLKAGDAYHIFNVDNDQYPDRVWFCTGNSFVDKVVGFLDEFGNDNISANLGLSLLHFDINDFIR